MFQLQSKEKEEVKKGTQTYIYMHKKVEILKKLRYCCFIFKTPKKILKRKG